LQRRERTKHDLFLERKRLQKRDLEASTPRIVQKWALVDAPDGPNRASEKRPTHLAAAMKHDLKNRRRADFGMLDNAGLIPIFGV
jgi:hypothetical protein